MISIINYGLGNIQAFKNIYDKLNIANSFVSNSKDIDNAEKLILPGVGSFDWAMHYLEKSGMRDSLEYAVRIEKKPILGVCVGMQMMAESSEEGNNRGLGWISTRIKKLQFANKNQFVLPHMGWNEVSITKESKLFRNLNKKNFYFLHSYFIDPIDNNIVLSKVNYGDNFCCAINQDNIFGTQFHPEKSHESGILLLKNFSEI